MTELRIPLVRPSLPDPARFIPMWEESTAKSGTYSNFGPLWQQAAAKLSKMAGRLAFPCSSGTEAVSLAIEATRAEKNIHCVEIEAFTFEAGRIAAQRADKHAFDIRSTDLQAPNAIVVRTIPFGSQRYFSGTAHKDEHTVIDAAGAFGPGAFKDNVRDDKPIAVSFHATKNFPIGEGGAVLLPWEWEAGAAAVMRAMNFGFNEAKERSEHYNYKTNAKIDELRCAMLISQLDRVDYFRERSARIRRHTLRIVERCSGYVEKITAPYQLGEWQSLVVIDCANAEQLGAGLAARGIASRRVYQPCRRPDLLEPHERELLALPSDCTNEEIEIVANAICEVS